MDLYSAIQYVLFVGIVTALVRPLGGYMERVFSRQRTGVDRFCLPIERLIYRITFVDPDVEMTGKQYATCFVLFALVGRSCCMAFSDCNSFFLGSFRNTIRRHCLLTWL